MAQQFKPCGRNYGKTFDCYIESTRRPRYLQGGGDFNVTLRADDRPNGGSSRDPGSSQFWDIIALLGIAEMGPTNCRFTWRGPSTQSRLDCFLCSPELLAASPSAEVSALPRPLSDHTPICWSSMVGPAKPTYFKLNRS